jgi:hypothetical protein
MTRNTNGAQAPWQGAHRIMRNKHSLHLIVLALWVGSGLAHADFRNTVNKPFASKANGPMGTIIVPHQTGMQALSNNQGVQTFRQHNPNLLKRAAATYRRIERLGLRRRGGEVRFPRTLVHTLDGQLIQTDLARSPRYPRSAPTGTATRGRTIKRAHQSLYALAATTAAIGAPTNNLTFEFQGWSEADQAALQGYLNTAYLKAKLIYGPPAFSNTVKIIQDNTIQSIQGGVYDVTNNEIRIPPLTGNFPEDTYILLMLVLNAFHDDAIFYYDAWEQGFIGAAAYVIQNTPGVSPGYDPVDPGPFYCLSVYEAENQPELGNSTFYPASGATNMLVWRIAMARAAWLKCYIENPNFFAQFNEAYYANYTSELAGDVPWLKELAAGVVPTVEGTRFAEWYELQYVLDTSIRVGKKLYTWNIPLPDSVPLICELYQTTPTGSETPLGGQARTIYWNFEDNIQLYAEAGNVISIPAGGDTPGEGYLLPAFYNIGGPQRIMVQMDVAGLQRTYPYPYGQRGFELNENNLYGAIIGENAGTVDVTGGNGLTGVAVDRGVWGDRITTAKLSPMQVEVKFTNEAGQWVSRIVNIGWDSYICFLESSGHATASHTFAYDRNGLYLMSLPLQPLSPNLTEVLSTPLDRLLMAWWDPWFAGDDKYRLWPSFPFRSPGQAYWWRVLQDTTVSLEGLQPDPDQPFAFQLGGGWNLVGCPRLSIVPLDTLQVQQGESEPVTWAEALTQHLMQSGLYSYDQQLGYQLAEAFQPWQGYWMRCLVPDGVRLIFPPEAALTQR